MASLMPKALQGVLVVLLVDRSRGIALLLDIARRKVVYKEGAAPQRDLYDISSATP